MQIKKSIKAQVEKFQISKMQNINNDKRGSQVAPKLLLDGLHVDKYVQYHISSSGRCIWLIKNVQPITSMILYVMSHNCTLCTIMSFKSESRNECNQGETVIQRGRESLNEQSRSELK